MSERRSQDGRVRLVADETRLDALAGLGLLEDVPIERVRGATPAEFGGSGRGGAVRLALGDATVVVKTLRRGGLPGRLLGAGLGAWFFGARRVLDAVALAQRLLERGATTARPAFARIRRGALPGLRRLELATDEVAGARDAAAFFASAPPPAARRAALRACGAAVHALHEAGVRHADLNLGNLLVADGRAFVIDLERSTTPAPLTPDDRVENLARLLRSAEKLGLLGTALSRSDLLRFLHAYEVGARRELFAAVARRRRSGAWHRLGWRLFDGGRARA
jgi:3-deoxy-D-manno-octulosonic acid kinase